MIQNFTHKQLSQIIFLRGMAALMVCLFHLYCGNPKLFPIDSYPKQVLSYGYLGVPIFFVISGFIICYSLPDNYNLSQFKTFILRRLVRIEPPYFISILLILVLNYSGSYFTGIPLKFAWPDFFFHFIYLNNFSLGNYYNVVYWTLGIEFQFYVIIGLLFTILGRSQIALIATMSVFLACSFINVTGMQLIFQHLPIFGMGIITYFYLYKNQIGGVVFFALAAVFLLQIYFFANIPMFFSTILASTVLMYWKFRHRIFDFLSNISFSLYLTHTIIGGKIINLGLRAIHNDLERYALFFLALAASITFAYLFYVFIEKNAIAAGKKIRYKYAAS